MSLFQGHNICSSYFLSISMGFFAYGSKYSRYVTLFKLIFGHYGAIYGTIVTTNMFREGHTSLWNHFWFREGHTHRIFGNICKKPYWNWPKIARANVMTLKKWHADPLKYHLLLFHTIYIYIKQIVNYKIRTSQKSGK